MATGQRLDPMDVEELLRIDLTTDECPVSAPPVPPDLGATLPWAVVERDGGQRVNPVLDQHSVTVSVWAATWAEAMAAADRVAGMVAALPGRADASTQWRTAELTGLPSDAPDPAHPTIPRVQMTASVTCRAQII